jgi:hypothetical protein
VVKQKEGSLLALALPSDFGQLPRVNQLRAPVQKVQSLEG